MPNKSVFGGCWLLLVKRIHIAQQYRFRCNIDSFPLNQKDLEEISILPKIFCNMHIAHRNMRIGIKSLLPLTHTQQHNQNIQNTPPTPWSHPPVSF
jgi:hypothetical protein